MDLKRQLAMLGDQASLLQESDEWLDNHSQLIAARISMLADELDQVNLAKEVKAILRRRNLTVTIRDGTATLVPQQLASCI
jgi:hypothetical protein